MTTHIDDPDNYVPLADAMRTTLMQHDPKYGAVGAGDLNGQALADHLLWCIETWVADLEQQIGQGEQHAALQLAFDIARTTRDPMNAIIKAANFTRVHLDQKVTAVDNLGLPTDDGWRERHGVGGVGGGRERRQFRDVAADLIADAYPGKSDGSVADEAAKDVDRARAAGLNVEHGPLARAQRSKATTAPFTISPARVTATSVDAGENLAMVVIALDEILGEGEGEEPINYTLVVSNAAMDKLAKLPDRLVRLTVEPNTQGPYTDKLPLRVIDVAAADADTAA
ncbi:hypothetical protein [Actinoplanes sp. URMC 104]|uniref:hypothetical protein n=1 Tax=Actinoplanes sp. URMC 104 TaxID=3423409 RepID=UPI003F1D30EE